MDPLEYFSNAKQVTFKGPAKRIKINEFPIKILKIKLKLFDVVLRQRYQTDNSILATVGADWFRKVKLMEKICKGGPLQKFQPTIRCPPLQIIFWIFNF